MTRDGRLRSVSFSQLAALSRHSAPGPRQTLVVGKPPKQLGDPGAANRYDGPLSFQSSIVKPRTRVRSFTFQTTCSGARGLGMNGLT